MREAVADGTLVVYLEAQLGDDRYYAEGMSSEDAEAINLQENALLFELPSDDLPGLTSRRVDSDEEVREPGFGIGIPIDLSEGESGVYTFKLRTAYLSKNGDRFTDGRFIEQTFPIAVINEKDSPYGAGWGLAGQYRLYEGDGTVLLANGNGTEQIFFAPEERGQPYSGLGIDRSRLFQEEDGTFVRRHFNGTVERFDKDGFLVTTTDRNNNTTEYRYKDERLEAIVDPVQLETKFFYEGDRIDRIVDPADRITKFEYDSEGNLKSIKNPDEGKRTFTYANPDFKHLLTGQVHLRGSGIGNETLSSSKFVESIEYDDYGRVESGIRIDGDDFTLTPAQVFAVADPDDLTDGTPTELVKLQDVTLPEFPNFNPCFALAGHEPSTATEYLAFAEYKDFEGKEVRFEMSGFGQLARQVDPSELQEVYSRQNPDGRVTAVKDLIGNWRCYAFDPFNNMTELTDFPDGPRLDA